MLRNEIAQSPLYFPMFYFRCNSIWTDCRMKNRWSSWKYFVVGWLVAFEWLYFVEPQTTIKIRRKYLKNEILIQQKKQYRFTIVRVPWIRTWRPGQIICEWGKEETQTPSDYNIVIEINIESNQHHCISDAFKYCFNFCKILNYFEN